MTPSSITNLLLVGLFAWLGVPSRAHAQPAPRFKAVAFDYFVIFDAHSITPAVEEAFPGKGTEFTKAWQARQFDYCYLSSITGRHEDFNAMTDHALVYTAQAMKLDLTPEKKERLMDAYSKLKPWPDSVAALRRLKAAGVRVIALSNLTEKMLRANADNAGMTDLFDQFVPTEINGTFKPDPRAYALGMKVLNLKKEDILFAAFGGWDAYGAKSFGYTTYWVNRFHLPPEQIGPKPDATSNDFQGLLDFALGR
jgi:2-haloacid dehalogenase